jgi:hypothetical protein
MRLAEDTRLLVALHFGHSSLRTAGSLSHAGDGARHCSRPIIYG